jgi:hypothetical protein
MREMAVLMLVACGPSQVLLDYEATVASMQALVDEHAEAVARADSLEAVVPLESAYQQDWAALMGELGEEMEAMDGCSMRRGKRDVAMGMMDDADGTMTMMDHDMERHMADHDDHTELSQCTDEESAHQDAMQGSLDEMGEYNKQWRNAGMMCGSR